MTLAELIQLNRDSVRLPPKSGDTRTFQQFDPSAVQAQRQLRPAWDAMQIDPVEGVRQFAPGDDQWQQQTRRETLDKVQQAMTDPMMGGTTHLGGKLINYLDDAAYIKLVKKAEKTQHGNDISAAYQRRSEIAQHNATLPESEGGLALQFDNTALERAKAGGFRTGANTYHGTRSDIKAFDKNALGNNTGTETAKISFGTTLNPDQANAFASMSAVNGVPISNLPGQNIMPLFTRGEAATFDVPASLRSNNPLFAATLADAFDSGIGVVAAKNYGEASINATAPHVNANMPELIRSRFAHFDPAQKNSPNLLAGAVPLGFLTSQGLLGDGYERP